MDGTIVFIFLLDHLPESILNKTLEPIDVTHTEYSDLNQCDYHITDPLLQMISRELGVLMIPKWLNNEKNHSSTNQVNLDKTFTRKMNKFIDSSLETDRKTENKLLMIEHALHETNPRTLINHMYKHETERFTDEENVKIPIKAPMMAAIFESLSNVTAHTCGGTVVAPQWVLTAASCVNLLNNLNAESTTSAVKSEYTIIINATDPLIDGSAHNVTEVLVHPNNITSDVITRRIGRNPVLALMRIEPAVVLEGPPVFVSPEDSSQHVRVYGWTMNKSIPDHDLMYLTWFEALILSPQDCSVHYNISKDTSEICLATTDEYADIISQLSWGGPVVSHKGNIMGVSRGDSHAPLAAWPLGAHVDWIHNIVLH